MKFPTRTLALISFAALTASAVPALAADSGAIDALQQSFVAPPDIARPTVRWWWFGPAVVKPQLEREMTFMKQGGFGGFEVQPTYPLAVDGQYPDLRNFKFLSPEFFDMLGFTAQKAKEIGLRMDLTLGSGWPYGGPMFTREEAVQSIGDGGVVAIAAGQTTVAPAAGGGGGRRGGGGGAAGPIVAALLGPVTDAAPGASPYLPLTLANGVAQLPANLHGATQVHFFTYAAAQLMQVKRPALGAEGFIVDHYDPTAIKKFIDQVALPEINAMGANTPFTIFCDSLEISGEGWTPNFLAEFKQRRGYDLTPLLPGLFDNNFPKSAEIHEDYGKTVNEVFNDNFVKTFSQLAKDHNTRFRLQAYGTPPTTMMTYADADVDEGENYTVTAFSGTRWASSASHLLGRPVTSAESMTWLHSPVFMAAPIDIKAESNQDILNGINQFLFHGWPYTAPGVEYPGWRFYAAAVFNEKNPWWIAMPDVTEYITRLSYVMRQGTPANDVALYLPNEDGFTRVTPSNLQFAASNGGILGNLVSRYMPTILESGYDLDFMDDGVLALRGKVDGNTLAFGDVKYKVVVLPNVTRIPLATLKTFAEFANNGGLLIAVDGTPSMAPGYLATDADHQAIRDLSQKLFTGPNAKGIVTTSAQLAATLISKLRPDVAFSQTQPNLGFVHRHTDAGEVYFLANTSNAPITDNAIFRVDGLNAEWWDPTTGRVTSETHATHYSGATGITVSLPPYGAQLLVFTTRQLPQPKGLSNSAGNPPALDLSKDWDVTFKNSSPEPDPAPQHFATLHDWTSDPKLQFFSGVGTYTKQVTVPAAMIQTGAVQYLNFGEGQPARTPGGQGLRANIQPPIGDVAVVYVNGQRAGAVWCPPYRVDVTSLIKPGTNDIRIQVANRASNFMADFTNHPLPNYNTLNATYPPKRFDAQDLTIIQSLPSGLLATVQLTSDAQ